VTAELLHPTSVVALSDLVDSIDDRSGAWIVGELFSRALCHSTEAGRCPESLTRSRLTKQVSPLRAAAVSTSSRGAFRRQLEDQPLEAAELREKRISWFFGFFGPDRDQAQAVGTRPRAGLVRVDSPPGPDALAPIGSVWAASVVGSLGPGQARGSSAATGSWGGRPLAGSEHEQPGLSLEPQGRLR
jgi:hypothetical protein